MNTKKATYVMLLWILFMVGGYAHNSACINVEDPILTGEEVPSLMKEYLMQPPGKIRVSPAPIFVGGKMFVLIATNKKEAAKAESLEGFVEAKGLGVRIDDEEFELDLGAENASKSFLPKSVPIDRVLVAYVNSRENFMVIWVTSGGLVFTIRIFLEENNEVVIKDIATSPEELLLAV